MNQTMLLLVIVMVGMIGKGHLPTTKDTQQKKACRRYSRHSIHSWSMGVISPTSQLNAQFVAVLREAPFARMLRGRISGGYSQGIGPHEAPNAALYIITKMTTNVGVDLMLMLMKYAMADSAAAIVTAPVSSIGRLPQRSTTYHGGIVESRYDMAFIPVIRMAFRPCQPACSKTRGA